ncbi:MAG: hypothetical protein RIS29_2467 [Bacteroidota bacterium]|jgi:hypothetical protein
MAKYSTTKKNRILSQNGAIQNDKFNSVQFINQGTDTVVIDDNIELAEGASFSWDNHPDVVIDQIINFAFKGEVGKTRKLLVILFYIQEVQK